MPTWSNDQPDARVDAAAARTARIRWAAIAALAAAGLLHGVAVVPGAPATADGAASQVTTTRTDDAPSVHPGAYPDRPSSSEAGAARRAGPLRVGVVAGR